MAVKDNRILVDQADSSTGWTSIGSGSGAAGAAYDPDVGYDGGGSLTYNATTQVRGWIYNIGAGTYAGSHFYFLLNSGVVGLLDSKLNGGVRARFGTAADNNFIELYIGGNDFYPTTFGGGWALFVVDISYAFENYTTQGRSVGTVPSGPNAITFCGLTTLTASAPASNKVNSWIDNIYRLPAGEPGIIVEGENAGNPYTFSDVIEYTESIPIPTFRRGPGGSFVISTPLQFGNTTTSSTHSFSDTNAVLLWPNYPESNAGFYEIKLENTTGSTLTVTAGEKTGTGDDAIGTQGWLVQAESTANTTADIGYTIPNRWKLLANNNLVTAKFYGCVFNHGSIYNFENANAQSEIISTSFVDGNELLHSSNTQYHIDTGNSSLLQRLTVVSANTVDNQAFIKTIDPNQIKFSSFQFSNGHAFEISSLTGFPASTNTFTLTSDTFSGYSTANNNNDSTFYNNTGRAITVQITGGTTPTVREETGTDTEIIATVNLSITNMLAGSEIRVYDYTGGVVGTEVYGEEAIANNDSLLYGSITTGVTASTLLLVKVLLGGYNIERFQIDSGTDGASRRVEQSIDRVEFNP